VAENSSISAGSQTPMGNPFKVIDSEVLGITARFSEETIDLRLGSP
jgi:hypothetical protein